MILNTFFSQLKREFCNIIGLRQKPIALQIPITSRCNSRCLTCNIWKYKNRVDIDINKLSVVLQDDFFSEVQNVGLNGGEPSLHPNCEELISEIIKLPKLKNIYLISNCIGNERLLKILRNVHPICQRKGIRLNLQISLDGIGNIHDTVRGIPNSFSRTLKVIDTLYSNKDQYLDNFNIGCTISKYNVDYLPLIEEYLSQYNIKVYYHLAVPNKRIHNFDEGDFSVLSDPHTKQMAAEFFYSQYEKSTNRGEMCRNYLIYLYLIGKAKKRLFECEYLLRDVTINEELDTFLCATASEKAGNLCISKPSFKMYNALVKDTKKHCDTCIHYANNPNLRGLFTFYLFKIRNYKWIDRYKRLC